MEVPSSCNIVIVGAGIAGSSAAYHLAQAGVSNIIVLERGEIGNGVTRDILIEGDNYLPRSDDEISNAFPFAQRSGTAVLPSPASTIKMIVNCFPTSADDFIDHHGINGARAYLRLAHKGICIEKGLAKQVLPEPEKQLWCLGSLYLAEPHQVEEVTQEFDTLVQLGCVGIELWDKEKVQAATGGEVSGFVLGIYFPDDAIINSTEYSVGLLRAAARTGSVTIYENCPEVVSAVTADDNGRVVLSDGRTITCKHVVLATGGLFLDPQLAGVLSPCWSYLVGIKQSSIEETTSSHPRLPSPNSLNFFTWGFTHDWCMTNGYLRISGEDHYSALKPPRMEKRCASLAKWAVRKHPFLGDTDGNCEYVSQYGVYSETPDKAPLVGLPFKASRVCYLLGCNAWGQASLSYAATLIPGILGYSTLDDEQIDSLQVLSISRFAFLSMVAKGNNTSK